MVLKMAQPDVNGWGKRMHQRFRTNPSLKIIHCGEDEVLVKHGARSSFTRTITDEGRTRLLGRVLRCLPTSVEALLAENVIARDELDTAVELFEYLIDEGILVGVDDSPTQTYLETILEKETPLSTCTIGIIGAGHLGSRIAREFARLGVGELYLMDDRRLNGRELDQRFWDLPADMDGSTEPYVTCLREILARNNYHRVQTITAGCNDTAALQSFFEQVDFAVAATEIFSSEFFHRINVAALRSQTPWMSVYVDGSEACVGPIYQPGQTCCYNEFEVQHEATLVLLKDEYFTYKEAINEEGIQQAHFVLPPYLSVAGGYATTAALQFLSNGRSFLVGSCLRLDFENLSVDYEEVLRLPRCPICVMDQPVYRNLFA